MSASPVLSMCRDETGVKQEACAGDIVLPLREEARVTTQSFSSSPDAGAKPSGNISKTVIELMAIEKCLLWFVLGSALEDIEERRSEK